MVSARVSAARPMLLSTLMLCIASASLHGQAISSTQHAFNQPFSALDESLTRAADTLLLPPLPITIPAPTQSNADETPAKLNRIELRPRPMLDADLTLASARLDLLRPIIEPILRSRGVPTSMMAVVVVESAGRSTALSPKGARGLWQLMPDTARRYGLRVDEIHDDRVDLFKATDAAARYLRDLYAQFGDWKLALAAYNTGEGNVGSAILKARTQDFDQLANLRMLPLETRNYVPRVLATIESFGQSSTFGVPHPIVQAITVFALSKP